MCVGVERRDPVSIYLRGWPAGFPASPVTS